MHQQSGKKISFYRKYRKKLIKSWLKLRGRLMQNPLITALGFVVFVWISTAVIVLHYEMQVENHNINDFGDAIWWGVVTLLTVGYGDKFPITAEGRFYATILMVSGVCGIAIMTAKISSFFLERALRERRGFVDTSTLKNHYVICGWKEEMVEFLDHLLNSNPNIKAADLVLVNIASDVEIDKLLDQPNLKKVKIIRGEHFLEINLKRAAPERALKVLILADATIGANGERPTVTESDARTIMTAMALNNIARGVSIAAEIIDASMDQYLKLAQVNEIIYSREVSRMLLATTTGGAGIANVYHELLNPACSAFIDTKDVPEHFIGKEYLQLLNFYRNEKPKETVIGLLENSGNTHAAKDAALKRAQQTPNVSELVNNLQKVKALKFNQPIFNPKLDRIINEGTRIIVIEERRESDESVSA